MSNIKTSELEAVETSLLTVKEVITATNKTLDGGLIKRGLDTTVINEIAVNPDTKAQQQLNSALQNIAEILIRIEFQLKSIGE